MYVTERKKAIIIANMILKKKAQNQHPSDPCFCKLLPRGVPLAMLWGEDHFLISSAEQDLFDTHFKLNTSHWIAVTFPFLHEKDQEGIGKERDRDQ